MHGKEARRPCRSLAPLRQIRRGGVHARHDGHRPQPRTERRGRRGPRRESRRKVCVRFIPPIPGHVRRRGHGHRAPPVRARDRLPQEGERCRAGQRAHRGAPQDTGREVQEGLRVGGQDVPAGAARADAPGGRRGVRLVEQRPREEVHGDQPDRRPEGYRGEHPGDGVRQHGRDLGHRRVFHAQPLHGREPPLRRVPRQRAGRGRRRGYPHPGGYPHHEVRAPPGVRRPGQEHRATREALQGYAGHRVHRAGG